MIIDLLPDEIQCADCEMIFQKGDFHDCFDKRTVEEILGDEEAN